MKKPKKVLVLGSGALKIGEAGEFDYSGSQCLKAVREEGIKTVLVNPNIATIQTSEGMADKIYFLPINPYFVEKVIKKEKPDGILLSFGGQTALNCGIELAKKGVFKKYNVKVLGTQIRTILDTEDRDLFVKKLKEIDAKVPKGTAVNNISSALKAAKKISYPVMARIAFALGGRGSGIAKNEQELKEITKKAFTYTKQILIEEYLHGWKEIEYEVVRDKYDNCITVCNMENFDPMGIHTGESIVVAPSQTLTNSEYHKLREISIRVIKHLGIVGECNIQFALDPNSEDYRIIEVNARLSRSSALASKATGYPLAFIAAKLALGYSLTEIKNSVTKRTMACFEPALDYVVLKMPRWDLKKFRRVSKRIGSEMKSVGEVMAIGRKFEEALQKAIRMLHLGMHGLVCNKNSVHNLGDILENPTDERIFAIVSALKNGYSIDKIHTLTRIDKWFLYKIRNIIEIEKELKKYRLNNISKESIQKAKQHGFSDKQISIILKEDELAIRKKRKKMRIMPVVKQIDTLAAEYPAETNYLYLTYNGTENDIKFEKKGIIVLGSGSYSIGSSVEFDWCCVNCVRALKKLGYETIMVNYNPETVSTDYDICDRLYFDELSFETILDIYELEKPIGIILSMGGQIPNNLATKFHSVGVKILGTSPLSIDNAENRYKFSKLLDKLNIDQPEWKELTKIQDAEAFAEHAGYPVLIRPSYVLSGAAMNVAFSKTDLEKYLKEAFNISPEHPVVISKFITDAKEIEIDGVANKGNLVVWQITEHIENAGVHSGDATMVLPPQHVYLETIKNIKEVARKIVFSLRITGPFNIQFIAKDNDIKVIECNLRASRSFPFVSKVSNLNFIDIATRTIMGKDVKANSVLDLDHIGVKAPQFSFSRLKEADPTSSVEMASTGEVACLGETLEEAFLKSLMSTGFVIPKKKTAIVSIGGNKNRYRILDELRLLEEIGYEIFATEHTFQFLRRNGILCARIFKVHENKKPNIKDYIAQQKIGLVINIPNQYKDINLDDTYEIRRDAVDYSIPLITNLQLAKLLIRSLHNFSFNKLKIKEWSEYKPYQRFKNKN